MVRGRERRIVVSQAIALIIAVAALIVSVVGNSNEISATTLKTNITAVKTFTNSRQIANLQTAVRESAYNSCVLVTSIIFSFHTPQGRRAARLILAKNPELGNCTYYSTHIEKVRPGRLK